MSEKYIGFKLPPEMRAAVIERAQAEGINVSEWCRAQIAQILDGETPSVDAGYQQARRLAAQMASVVLANARAQLPDTYEEFIEMYGATNDGG